MGLLDWLFGTRRQQPASPPKPRVISGLDDGSPFVVGVDASGKRVKGEAVIELKPEIDPKRPKDPE